MSPAAIVTQMIGDDDAFGGSQSRLVRRSYSSPGDEFYNIAFPLRSELPASPDPYQDTAGMDTLTSTNGPFQFTYSFILDLTSLEEIESAEFLVQFGSVGYDPGDADPEVNREPSGFGHANVSLDGVTLGKLFSQAGPRGGLPGSHEEQVRQSTYDVKQYLRPGEQQTVTVTIGNGPYANQDGFAIDYVQLSAQGALIGEHEPLEVVPPNSDPYAMNPEPSAFLIWAILGILLASGRGHRYRGGKP